MQHEIHLMQERFPDIYGEAGEQLSVERSAAAAAAAYLVRPKQEVEGGTTGTDKIGSDIADVIKVLKSWAGRSALEDNFIASHPAIPDNPTVLVNLHGGLVQDVYGKDGPVDVIVVDWDQDGVTDEDMSKDESLFKGPDGKIGSSHLASVGKWEHLETFPEMVAAVENAESKYDEPIIATYVSEWDNGTTVRTPCKYDRRRRRCFDIQQSDTEVGDAQLLEEYVSTPDEDFHETEGVTFIY